MNRHLILIDKPVGTSSHAVLFPVKRAYGTRRVGHAGTLDPFASGLMIALVAPATRLSRYFTGLAKRYTAVVRFGQSTDTLDPTGTENGTGPLPDRERVDRAIRACSGTYRQIPPIYSALHVGGRRAYELARTGIAPDLPSREVSVTFVRWGQQTPSDWQITVDVSSGTYIRSLARDLGAAADTVALCTELRRESIGPFSVADACPPEGVDPTVGRDALAALAQTDTLREWSVSDGVAARISSGFPLHRIPGEYLPPPTDEEGADDRPILIRDSDGGVRAIVARHDGVLGYDVVFPAASEAGAESDGSGNPAE